MGVGEGVGGVVREGGVVGVRVREGEAVGAGAGEGGRCWCGGGGGRNDLMRVEKVDAAVVIEVGE